VNLAADANVLLSVVPGRCWFARPRSPSQNSHLVQWPWFRESSHRSIYHRGFIAATPRDWV